METQDFVRAGRDIAPVPMQLWGRDHDSTLLYIETRCVDYGGRLDHRHMRCDPRLHRAFAHEGSMGPKYPTRLAHRELENHDDWSCVEDMEAAGLLTHEYLGGTHVVVTLTQAGRKRAQMLRERRSSPDGGPR